MNAYENKVGMFYPLLDYVGCPFCKERQIDWGAGIYACGFSAYCGKIKSICNRTKSWESAKPEEIMDDFI